MLTLGGKVPGYLRNADITDTSHVGWPVRVLSEEGRPKGRRADWTWEGRFFSVPCFSAGRPVVVGSSCLI